MIIADFSKKNLVKENKIQKLKKSAIYKGDLEEHWSFFRERSRMDGKEPLQEHASVWEKLLYNIYFLLIKFSRISYADLHLCSLLFFFQMLIKHLKTNFYMNEPHLRGNFFVTALRHCLLLKASGSMTISPWLSFSGKIQTFLLLLPLPPSPPSFLCAFLLKKAIPYNKSHCFYLFPFLCFKIN